MARILVVDDDPDMRALLQTRLESWGHEVRVARSVGTAGQTMMERGKPDVVVLDIMMPGLNGFDFVRSLRSRPDLRHIPIPVIFLSGLTEPEDIAKGEALGAQYLTKPFDASELEAAIGSALRRS